MFMFFMARVATARDASEWLRSGLAALGKQLRRLLARMQGRPCDPEAEGAAEEPPLKDEEALATRWVWGGLVELS